MLIVNKAENQIYNVVLTSPSPSRNRKKTEFQKNNFS